MSPRARRRLDPATFRKEELESLEVGARRYECQHGNGADCDDPWCVHWPWVAEDFRRKAEHLRSLDGRALLRYLEGR